MKPNKQKYKIQAPETNQSTLIMKSIIQEQAEMMCGKFSFEDFLIAGGYSDGMVQIYNINTGCKVSEINTNFNNEKIPVNSLRWRPSSGDYGSVGSILLVANTNGHLLQYAAKTGKKLFQGVEEDNYILALDYSKDGKQFATGGKDNIVRLYDEETKKILSKLSGVKWHSHGHNNRIFSIKFSSYDPNIMASGGWDQNICIWDLRDHKTVSTIYGPRIAGDSIDIYHEQMLTGSNRSKDQLQLWDWQMGKVIKKFRWQENEETNCFVFSCQFCKNLKGTLIGVGGNKMKIFDVDTTKEFFGLTLDEEVSLYTCDTGHNSNRYFVGGNTGALYYMMSTKSYD